MDFESVEENDPLKLKAYVNKTVKVRIHGGQTYEGIVFTIDPICRCLVLICKENDREIPLFILKDSIVEMTTTDSTGQICLTKIEQELNLLESATQISENEKIRRRTVLKNMLLRDRLPIIEDGDKLKMEDPFLVINPPYGPSDVLTDNVQVLESMREKIEYIHKQSILNKSDE